MSWRKGLARFRESITRNGIIEKPPKYSRDAASATNYAKRRPSRPRECWPRTCCPFPLLIAALNTTRSPCADCALPELRNKTSPGNAADLLDHFVTLRFFLVNCGFWLLSEFSRTAKPTQGCPSGPYSTTAPLNAIRNQTQGKVKCLKNTYWSLTKEPPVHAPSFSTGRAK